MIDWEAVFILLAVVVVICAMGIAIEATAWVVDWWCDDD